MHGSTGDRNVAGSLQEPHVSFGVCLAHNHARELGNLDAPYTCTVANRLRWLFLVSRQGQGCKPRHLRSPAATVLLESSRVAIRYGARLSLARL